MSQLWKDESGFIVSADLVLVSCILVLGMMVGLVSIRDQIVQELGDVGAAFAVLNQSYEWDAITGHTSSVAGSVMIDVTDFCDAVSDDPIFPSSLGIVVDAAAAPERPN
jgi:hypothetical protein